MSITKQFLREISFLNFNKNYYKSAYKDIRRYMFQSGELKYSTTFNGFQLPEKSPIPSIFEDARVPSTSSPKTKDVIGVIKPRRFLEMANMGDVKTNTLDWFLKMYRQEETIRFQDVPYFSVKKDEDETDYVLDPDGEDMHEVPVDYYNITGHEGRHRSLIMMLMGFEDEWMPIRITSWRNRFKEEVDGDLTEIKLKPENNAPTVSKGTIKIISK